MALGSMVIYTVLILLFHEHWVSLVAQLVKNLSAMQETPVQFVGQEDPLQKE